jgi:hypothetical protein
MYTIKYNGEAVSISSTVSFISEITESILMTLNTGVVIYIYFVQ